MLSSLNCCVETIVGHDVLEVSSPVSGTQKVLSSCYPCVFRDISRKSSIRGLSYVSLYVIGACKVFVYAAAYILS